MDKLIALKTPGMDPIKVTGIPSGADYTIGSLAGGGIKIAMIAGIIMSLFYLTYGGFYWLQARGDKENLDKARRIILYSIVGLILMSLALVIVNILSTALGIDPVTR